ncbi:MAG: phytanoyl-CoA dioxygenase family protein [Lentisphaerae bacterium]|nr:phytanoyl-CoA dioxygenase family protein [Lentisphaerota bacterium]
MLTQTQLDHFHRDGLLVIRNVLSAREVEELLQAVDRCQAEGIAQQGTDHKYHTHADGRKVYRRSEKMWRRGDIFQAVTVKPALLEMVGQCIGHPFLPLNDSLVVKLPGGNVPVPWHQDPPYGQETGYEATFDIPNFVADLYLDESTLKNGCVWAIRGHHLVGHINLRQFTEDQLFAHPLAEPLEMKPGDVLLHALSAPHGSAGNTSDTYRRIFYIHYMARDVLEHGYPDIKWMGLPGMYSDAGKAYAHGMLDVRRRMGFGDAASQQVTWTPDGFTVTGQPATPRHYWKTLREHIPADKAAAMRQLNWNP